MEDAKNLAMIAFYLVGGVAIVWMAVGTVRTQRRIQRELDRATEDDRNGGK